MATNIPAKLRSADIGRVTQRAAQVERVKPAVAYWGYYYAVQLILGKGLHNSDDECKNYTSELMDKIEAIKAANPTDDAILDDMAAQAYIEQFGLETFQRADNAMGANKSSRQTADTFQAAATFLELVNVWGQPGPELTSKIKYAKFHAVRIAKALKAGEDPNASNPAPIPAPNEEAMELDAQDPEVVALRGDEGRRPRVEDVPDETQRRMSHSAGESTFDESLHPSRDQSRTQSRARPDPMWPPRPARVEDVDVPDDTQRRMSFKAGESRFDQSLHPSRDQSTARPPQPDQSPGYDHDTAIVSPAPDQASDPYAHSRQDSSGGGYFPEVQLPEVPSDPSTSAPSTSAPAGPLSPAGYVSPSSAAQYPPSSPQDFYTSSPAVPPPAPAAPHAAPYAPPFSPPTQQPRSYGQSQQPPPPQQPRQPQQPMYRPSPQEARAPPRPAAPIAAPSPPPQMVQEYMTDDTSIVDSQKHAKWAISALNFEDVPTAVKELREALRSLGAT